MVVHKARNGNFSLPGPRVVSPKVIYLYRKCKEFDLNCVSNRALTVACKHPGVVSPLGGSVLPSLSSCVLLRAVCCAVTRKFSNYLLVLFWFGCLHHFCHSFSTETLWRNLFYQEQQTSCLFVAVCCFNLFVVLVKFFIHRARLKKCGGCGG